MRIGVISDTHIPAASAGIPRIVLEDFSSADMVVHAGDLADLRVLDELKNACRDVRAVYGNMDPPEVQRRLPKKLFIKTGRHKIGVLHGWGPPNRLIGLMAEEFKGEGCDLIIFGHSHCAAKEQRNSTLYFNPGSVTDKMSCEYNSYGIIEINDSIEAKIIRI